MAKLILLLVKVSIFLQIALLSHVAFASSAVRFCFPDQDVPPFYIHQQDQVTGIATEQLKLLFQDPSLENVDVKWISWPWKRCIKGLEKGEVDLVIAGYSHERAKIAVFPDQAGFKLEDAAFSDTQICFVKHNNAQWLWDGRQIKSNKDLVLGLEAGYIVPQQFKVNRIKRHFSIWDVEAKFQLLDIGRVDALLTVCGVMNHKMVPESALIPSNMTVVYPAYFNTPAYLLFSHNFFRDHRELTQTIISTANKLEKKDIRNLIQHY